MRRIVTAAGVALALFAARPAGACGGFFCNTPTPVDQTAEQIAFASEGGKGATYVQIQFTGSAPDFGWIVPVMQVPEKVEVVAPTLFTELQRLTAPQFVFPSFGSDVVTSGCGGACADADVAMSRSAEEVPKSVEELGGGSVGPYDWVVVQSTDATELLSWLAERRYNVSTEAVDIVQRYLDKGAKFVALKLIPSADVSQLTPVKFTFPAFEPCVPLRLTAVSARPDMGVVVYVLGETRAVPQLYREATVDHTTLRVDFSQPGGTDYRTVLGNAVDAAGGRAFVTEYAGRSSVLMAQATDEATRSLLKEASYVTRLYTVISPDEMTEDPLFEFSAPGELQDVSNVHPLEQSQLSGGALFWPLGLALALRRRRR